LQSLEKSDLANRRIRIMPTTEQTSPSPRRQSSPGNGGGESNHDKFRRLTIQRVRAYKRYGRLVKNCAAYEHTSDEKEKVIAEIFRTAHEIKSAFENAGKAGPKRDEWSL
jgi:hypothetical protein